SWPASSRPTCRGTTPRRRATSVRASASTPSTSSSRRASACPPSSPWRRTRRSCPPYSRRRAAQKRRTACAPWRDRERCVASLSSPARAPRRPRLHSARVLVVSAPPDARAFLVAPHGGVVEPLVHAPEAVQSARVGGIGVVDDAVLERERAQARPLPR